MNDLAKLYDLKNQHNALQEKIRQNLKTYLVTNSVSYFNFGLEIELSETTLLRFCNGENLKFGNLAKIIRFLEGEKEHV